MKNSLVLLGLGAIIVPVLLFSASSVYPAIPHLMNYQGMLTNNAGTPPLPLFVRLFPPS